MKHLQLKNSEYKRLETSFGEWLVEINYAAESTQNMPVMLREFLYYLEQHDINKLTAITPAVIDSYFYYLSIRSNYRQAGALHTNTLLNHRKVLSRFSYYLQQIGLPNFEISLRLDRQIQLPTSILTQEEITKLYNSIPDTIMGYRDRAILAVYYGCGLRKNEGANLVLSDLLFKEARIYVRKGKNYKERYVPMNERVIHDLQNYIQIARPMLLAHRSYDERKEEVNLFLTNYGRAAKSDTLYFALKKMLARAKMKSIGLHSLRHSIATHLLQSGMSTVRIAQFLGHSSLSSTAIYLSMTGNDK